MPFAFLRLLWRRSRAPMGPESAGGWRSIGLLGVYLVAVVLLHVAAMMAFEGLTLSDAAWLTATTMTTVGYGDVSAATPWGRASTVVLLYIGGIFVLAKAAGDYFDYRASRRQRMIRGMWRWNMEDHILLISAPETGAELYFDTLVRQFRKTEWGGERPVLILTESWPDGLPPALLRLAIVHVHGRGVSQEALASADAERAAAIIVLAEDVGDARSDAVAFDVVHRLRGLNPDVPILAECVDDRNRERLRAAGASTVMRPMRGYPEMMVRAVIAPGSESIIETLFTTLGDECVRYEVAAEGVEWGRLASALILEGAGTPIGFADAGDDTVKCNPLPSERVDVKALFVIVKEGHEVTADRVRHIVAGV